jgi:hypothetical protein
MNQLIYALKSELRIKRDEGHMRSGYFRYISIGDGPDLADLGLDFDDSKYLK